MAFKMKNPSIAKMVKMAGNSRTMAKMKMEAAAKMKKPMKLKEEPMKMKKDDSMAKQADTTYTKGSTKTATVTVTKGDKKTEYPTVRYLGDAKHKKVLNSLPGAVFKGGKNTGDAGDVDRDKYSRFMSRMDKGEYTKPIKMKKDDTMAKKALVGKQKNLPPELKAAIEAAPGKLKKNNS